MAQTVKRKKISDLASANAVNDENILIVDDGAETYKVSANDLAEYINGKSSAQPNVQSDWSEADTESDSYIKNKPTSLAANGGDADTVNGHTVNADVPGGAKFTDTVYTHPDSGVAAGTYSSVTVDEQGHVTSGSTPTTLSGYGITDAATLEQGERADTAVQSVKIGTIEYKSGTTVTLPAYPTTLPAADIYEWAKAETKPTYTAAEVGADEEGSADAAYENAKVYTDDRITQLIGTSPENLDTIEELSAAISENQSAIDAIENAITNKASADHNHDESYAAKSSEHTHENKTVLDTITSDRVLSWDNKDTYYSLSQIDASYDYTNFSYTMLPKGSILHCSVNVADVSNAYQVGLIPINGAGTIFAVNAAARGFVLFTTDKGKMYFATSDNMNATPISSWAEVVQKSDIITTYSDLMANTASGYLQDSLAVKEGFDRLGGLKFAVVSALPSDAASHTDTVYIVTG